jgi:hypothetical protein
MNVVRGGLLCAVAASMLLGVACSADKPGVNSLPASGSPSVSADPAASTAPVGAGATSSTKNTATPASSKRADVNVGIVTALSTTSVTWIDGEIVPGNDDSGHVINRLSGASHVQTATLAGNVVFYTVFDNQGMPQLDKDGVGTVPCSTSACKADFTKMVLDSDLNAPRITFDAQGKVSTIAARYHP